MQPARVVGLQEAPPRAGLLAGSRLDVAATLDRMDAARYASLRHVPACLDEIEVSGRRVLEVGFGDGSEAELLITSGARYSGLDIDAGAVERTAARMKVRGLPYDALRHGDVRDLPWPDASFDVVFTHGLLDRIDHLDEVERELRRVLLPGGRLVVMVRARRSWHYRVTLGIVRRAGLAVRVPLARAGVRFRGRAGERLAAARRDGFRRASAPDALLAWGEDDDRAPLRVFTTRELATALPSFDVVRASQHHGPLGRWLGWHLWVHLTPKG